MGKNPKYTQQDYQQSMRRCIDEDNDALRVVVTNEADNNLKEVFEKFIDISSNKKEEIKQDFIPKWIKMVVIFQSICTFGMLLINIIKK